MKLKLFLSFSLLFMINSGVLNAQNSKFNPEFWLYNPQPVRDTVKEFNKLNFQSRLFLGKNNVWTSAKKINNSNHLFLVYKSNKDENLMALIGSGKSLFIDSKKLKINDSIDLDGYNEAYGELLEVQFSGIDNGKFWLNPSFKESNLFEIILIEKNGQPIKVNDIRTYLSIKYGIDLIDSKQYGYSGKEWWDGKSKLYNHNVFGIARMDQFNLNNFKSIHSKDQDLIVFKSQTVGGMLNEGEYVLVGNNKKELSFDKKSKLSRKEWLVQTNKTETLVDLAFPLKKLNQSPDSFTNYELIVGEGSTKTVYSSEVADSLLIFRKVAFSSAENSIVRLKEHKSDLKFEVVNTCNQFQLKVKAPSNISNYSVKIFDDKNNNVLSSVDVKEVYTVNNSSSAYFDINLTYNNKKLTKRISTDRAVLTPVGLNKHYVLNDESVNIKIQNAEGVNYQWFKNDQQIGSGNQITLNEEGNYSLKVSTGEDCSQTQTFTVRNNINDGGWRLYPNPAASDEQVNVSFQLPKASDVHVAIYSNEGKLLKTMEIGTVQNQTYSLGALKLSSGVYIVVAYINQIPQIKKIIIK